MPPFSNARVEIGASSFGLRHATFGPLAATAMLSLNVALGAALADQGIAEFAASVPVRAGEIVGEMASFAVVTVVAAALLVPLLRRLPATDVPAPDTALPQVPQCGRCQGVG